MNCLTLVSLFFVAGCSFNVTPTINEILSVEPIDYELFVDEGNLNFPFFVSDAELENVPYTIPTMKPVLLTVDEVNGHRFFNEVFTEEYDYVIYREFHTGDPIYSSEKITSDILIPHIIALPDREAQAIICMALNIYHEARGSTVQDQMATSYIVLNRVEHPSFPLTVCDVIWEYIKTKRGKYIAQFSWTRDGFSDIPRTKSSWELAQKIAYIVIKDDSLVNIVDNRLNYFAHNSIIPPRWARNAEDPIIIGSHTYLTAKRQLYCESCKFVKK